MYYPIAGIDYFACIWNQKVRVFFAYAVYCFTHYFCFSLYSTDSQSVFLKDVKTFGVVFEKTFQFIYCIKYIL